MNFTFASQVASVMPNALASGILSSLCTIQQPDGLLVDAGQPSGNYVDVVGMVDIPCTDPPQSTARIIAEEAKSEDNIQRFNDLHVLLGGWYPDISATGTTLGWRAVIGGVNYDIKGAEDDSQRTMTRLALRASGI